MTEIEKEQLYRDYYRKVYGYVFSKINNSLEAEDIAADVFVKVYEKLDTFDSGKASLSTWIYSITRNTLTDYYRTRKVSFEIPETVQSDQNVEDEVINGMMLERLATALSKMQQQMRDVVILRYYEGKTLREIADRMGVSYAYVKVIQNKAFDFLKKYLENE